LGLRKIKINIKWLLISASENRRIYAYREITRVTKMATLAVTFYYNQKRGSIKTIEKDDYYVNVLKKSGFYFVSDKEEGKEMVTSISILNSENQFFVFDRRDKTLERKPSWFFISKSEKKMKEKGTSAECIASINLADDVDIWYCKENCRIVYERSNPGIISFLIKKESAPENRGGGYVLLDVAPPLSSTKENETHYKEIPEKPSAPDGPLPSAPDGTKTPTYVLPPPPSPPSSSPSGPYQLITIPPREPSAPPVVSGPYDIPRKAVQFPEATRYGELPEIDTPSGIISGYGSVPPEAPPPATKTQFFSSVSE